jgi:IS30 family transposase
MKQEKNIKYRHIKKEERLEISILLSKGYSMRNIAEVLGRNVSSISREIRDNSVKGVYDPFKANHKAYVKRKYSKYQGMKVVGNIELREYVESNLKKGWSPELIAGRIRNIDKDIKCIGFKGIYKYVYSPYGRNLERYLRYKGNNKRKVKRAKVTQLKDRIFIDNRPDIINTRERHGDWEGDLIVSGKNGRGVLVVLYERRARYVKIRRVMSQKPDIVNRHIYEMTGGLICFNSLTIDNDICFQKHIHLSRLINAPVYFCHPYHSWEKGGVENVNKLIREYIPKSTNISKYDDEYIRIIQDNLNNRPKKCLDYKTPLEVMLENKQFMKPLDYVIMNTIKKNNTSVALEGTM